MLIVIACVMVRLFVAFVCESCCRHSLVFIFGLEHSWKPLELESQQGRSLEATPWNFPTRAARFRLQKSCCPRSPHDTCSRHRAVRVLGYQSCSRHSVASISWTHEIHGCAWMFLGSVGKPKGPEHVRCSTLYPLP